MKKYTQRPDCDADHPDYTIRSIPVFQDGAPGTVELLLPVGALVRLDADILVTHEAFSCHHHGWEALDQLARDLQVVRAFHGHTHDDRTDQYREHRERLGFEAVAVNFRRIKNGLVAQVFNYVGGAS